MVRKVYWRPSRVSHNVFVVIATIALVGLFLVQSLPEQTSQAAYQQMVEASSIARDALEVIKQERLRKGISIHPVADPSQSGLIGASMSDVTTTSGHLPAKQTTVNPNWAAVVVYLLKEANVREGDVVAVGISGSFPALNVAIFAACEALRLNPVVISSASSSQWGANHSNFLWVEMERKLHEKKIFSFRSTAASLGGVEDRALGLSDSAHRTLKRAISRAKLPMIEPENYAESVVERMAIYREHAGDQPIRAYINVGGSTTSVGTSRSKYEFQPGLNTRLPPKASTIDSVMARFLDEGTPVIHFLQIERLAARYGLPIQPMRIPAVGTGQIFIQRRYNPVLAASVLAVVIGSLFLFIRSGRGRLAFEGRPRSHDSATIEPSV